MIQNYLVFCVDAQAKYVQGSIPVGKLTANDINRNSIWVISPFYPTGTVRGSFQTKDRVIEQVSSTGILRNDKISVDELVPTSASYYELVKDWNVWEIKVPQRILEFLSHHRTSEIGISFELKDFIVPKAPYGFNFIQNIDDPEFVVETIGYYIIKIPQYVADEKTFRYNDILTNDNEGIKKLNRIVVGGNTPTVNYLVDPAIPADNYESTDEEFTDDILATLNEHGVSINALKDKIENDTIQQANDTDTIDIVLINDAPYGRIIEANLKINESKNDFIKNDNNNKGIYVSTVDIQESIDDAIKSNGTEINESIKDLIHAEAFENVADTNSIELDVEDETLSASLKVDPAIDNTIEVSSAGVKVAGLKTSAGVQYTLDQIFDMISITILDE
jgi:hypothetical protein